MYHFRGITSLPRTRPPFDVSVDGDTSESSDVRELD